MSADGRPDGDDPDRETWPPEEQNQQPAPADGSFDWRGWALVGAIVVCFLLLPGVVLFLPAVREQIGALGLTWRDAYLVLPLLPALILGTIAVWSAMRARSRE